MTSVVRQPRSRSFWQRRRFAALGLSCVAGLLVVVGAVVASRGGGESTSGDTSGVEVRSAVSIAPTVVTDPTPHPDGPVAPLTGVAQNRSDAGLLERPALVVKVDNHPKALPQRGLDVADVVVELRVEGISRFVAVFHSRDIDAVAPVRSARTSDPDLLAMFGRPLFAWSGANEATVETVHDTPWLHNIDPSRLESAYSRSSERSAPHNLVLDAHRAFEAADPQDTPPVPLFEYLAPDRIGGGAPTVGFDLAIGSSAAGFEWSAPRNGWLRWTDGRVHTAPSGDQLAPTNVVVLETEYVASGADSRSPEARTLGTGRAWIFTQGRMIEGRWSRSELTESWRLTDAGGAPVSLTPGTTWVELPETGELPRLRAAASDPDPTADPPAL